MAEGDTTTATRHRFNGELTLDNIEEESPVKRAGADLTQFKALVQASWDKVQANEKAEEAQQAIPNPAPSFGVTIPAEGKTLAETRFRQAAQELGVGISVQVVEPGTQQAAKYELADDQVRLIICARKKKAPKAPKPEGEQASTPAAPKPLPKPAARK